MCKHLQGNDLTGIVETLWRHQKGEAAGKYETLAAKTMK